MSGPEEPIGALTEAEAAELVRARFPELARLEAPGAVHPGATP